MWLSTALCLTYACLRHVTGLSKRGKVYAVIIAALQGTTVFLDISQNIHVDMKSTKFFC